MHGEPKTLLRELKARLIAIYATRLRSVYLYGSYARGDCDPESDFDVLVVLDDFSSYGAEVDRTAEPVATLSLEHAVSISLVFLREREWTADESPFVRSVRGEAIAA
jgi:predicted nucleotidyltransferase